VETPMRRAAMALAWLVVVTAVASLTWFVIGRAGRAVGVVQLALPAAATTTAGPVTLPAPSDASPTPTDDEDDATPGPTSSPTPRPTSQGPAPAQTRPPTRPAGPAAVRATFSTRGGTVTVSCTGSAISLVSATPQDGYRLNRDDEEGMLDISFTSGYAEGEQDDESVELHLGCQDGAPVSRHESSDS